MKDSTGRELTRSEAEALIKGRAAITISIMAAVIAILAMVSGSNSSRVLNNTIAANSQWAWYQAKNVRQVLYETAALQAAPEAAKKLQAEADRMRADKAEIKAQAEALEAERDVAKKRGPWFTYAASLLQIGVVLTTASILAVTMTLFWAGLAAGTLGALAFANGYWMLFFV